MLNPGTGWSALEVLYFEFLDVIHSNERLKGNLTKNKTYMQYWVISLEAVTF